MYIVQKVILTEIMLVTLRIPLKRKTTNIHTNSNELFICNNSLESDMNNCEDQLIENFESVFLFLDPTQMFILKEVANFRNFWNYKN